MFVDRAQIYVKAGDGGDGCVSFRREKFVPRGGPDGGNGGSGGDVVLEADSKLQTLADFRYHSHFKSQSGAHGSGKNKKGKAGEMLAVRVPVGTVVSEAATGEVLADLVEDGSRVIAAEGGNGGRGNASMKSSTNRSPRIRERGQAGGERSLNLELRIIADVGVIGCPNAGKSTLIAHLSNARPKIADYPFTTLKPALGIVEYEPFKRFIIAEIPGLVKGAHRGKGLGDDFLRHVKRTRVLVHLVDLSKKPYEDYTTVNEELKLYSSELIEKPQIVVANKIDLPEAEKNFRELVHKLGRNSVLAISALKGTGLSELLEAIGNLLKNAECGRKSPPNPL